MHDRKLETISGDEQSTPARDSDHPGATGSHRTEEDLEFLDVLRRAVEQAGEAILITEAEPIDGDGPRVLYVNPAFERITGWSRVEMVGKTPRVLQGPKTDPAARQRIREALTEWKQIQQELVNYRKDGSEFRIGLSIAPVADESGWFTHWIAIQRDTTEQAIQRERLRLAQQVAGLGTLDVEFASGQWICCPRAAGFLGLSTDAGKRGFRDILSRVCKPDRSQFTQAFRRARRGEDVHLEFRVSGPGGGDTWIEATGVPVSDSQGKPTHALFVLRDISAVKLDGEELRLNEERLRLAQDAAQIGIFDVELPSGKRSWSPRTCEIFGRSPDMPAPTLADVLAVVHPEDRQMVERFAASLGDGRNGRYQYRIMPRPGGLRWVEISGRSILNEAGQPVRYLGVAADITDRKSHEALLQRTKDELRALAGQLQRAAENERLRIARDLHDEVGQALTGLKMDLEWILRKHGVNNEACVPLLEDALKVLDGLVGTVRQISTELRPELLDALGLRAAIERYVNQFERRSGIHCTVRMPEESTGLTLDQKIAVFRIVQEALTNVARHAQAATVLIALDRKDAGAILTLQDDGVGFILNEADWAKSPGLLGMRERAYLLGADLSIHSVPGRGTSVTLRLPLNR